MEGTYEVTSAGQAVGSVRIIKQGLYYHFFCRCRLTGEVIFRLTMDIDNRQQDLGILVPHNGYFELDTYLSIKKAGEGQPRFFLRPKHERIESVCVAVCPEEPFAFLTRLETAFLVRQNGEKRIAFREEK